MKTTRSTFLLSFLLTQLALVTSCDSLVEVDPPRSKVAREVVFEDDFTAIAAISKLYSRLTASAFNEIIYPASLSADELMKIGTSEDVQFYNNEISPLNSIVESIWRDSYAAIYNANSIIEGLRNSESLSTGLRDQLLGEAKFFRAFYYFYLTNLFGDVPHITSTDYRVNGLVKRVSTLEVYDKIITDLAESRELLSEDFSYSNHERVRVNKWAAIAFLARVYLYKKDWPRAEEQATRVIEKNSLFKLNTNLNEVFLRNSVETIWQLIPPYPKNYTSDGNFWVQRNYNAENATMSSELINSFEPSDQRKINWIGVGSNSEYTWYYPLKYKETSYDTVGGDEYSTVLRLAEQFLIRAEARTMQDKVTGSNSAASDVNMIRSRAGLPPTPVTTQEDMLNVIAQERRTEFFTEWGHRWFDLKRSAQAGVVLSLMKPEWQNTDSLYPIPTSELLLNPNITQNSGY